MNSAMKQLWPSTKGEVGSTQIPNTDESRKEVSRFVANFMQTSFVLMQ